MASIAGSWYRVTLEVVLRFFGRQQVDLLVARATQRDRPAFDPITRPSFWVFPVLMPRGQHKMMRGDLPHLTAA